MFDADAQYCFDIAKFAPDQNSFVTEAESLVSPPWELEG